MPYDPERKPAALDPHSRSSSGRMGLYENRTVTPQLSLPRLRSRWRFDLKETEGKGGGYERGARRRGRDSVERGRSTPSAGGVTPYEVGSDGAEGTVPDANVPAGEPERYEGDARDLSFLPAQSVDLIVTSPPYWRRRDYGHDDQLGQEPTPEEYVEALVEAMDGWARVLKPHGSVFLNLGDTYRDGFLVGCPGAVRGSGAGGGVERCQPRLVDEGDRDAGAAAVPAGEPPRAGLPPHAGEEGERLLLRPLRAGAGPRAERQPRRCLGPAPGAQPE